MVQVREPRLARLSGGKAERHSAEVAGLSLLIAQAALRPPSEVLRSVPTMSCHPVFVVVTLHNVLDTTRPGRYACSFRLNSSRPARRAGGDGTVYPANRKETI